MVRQEAGESRAEVAAAVCLGVIPESLVLCIPDDLQILLRKAYVALFILVKQQFVERIGLQAGSALRESLYNDTFFDAVRRVLEAAHIKESLRVVSGRFDKEVLAQEHPVDTIGKQGGETGFKTVCGPINRKKD